MTGTPCTGAPPPRTPLLHRGGPSAAQPGPAHALHRFSLSLRMRHDSIAPSSEHSNARTCARRRACPLRAAAAVESTALSPANPRCGPRSITHGVMSIPDPSSGRFVPRSTKIGELRRVFSHVPPREENPGEFHRRRRPRSTSAVRSETDALD